MRKEKQKEVKKDPEFSGNGHENGHKEGAKLELVELLFRTPDERMPELTNIPLNQVLPLSMVVMGEAGIKMLADRASGKGGIYDENGKPILLSEVWRKSYAQYRRSIRGDHKMALATLTQEEMSARIEEGLGEAEEF